MGRRREGGEREEGRREGGREGEDGTEGEEGGWGLEMGLHRHSATASIFKTTKPVLAMVQAYHRAVQREYLTTK